MLSVAIVIDASTVAARLAWSPIMTGGRFVYTTAPGDSLTLIGARYGVEVRAIAGLNDLSLTTRLRVGQPLLIDNRHLIPELFGAPIEDIFLSPSSRSSKAI